MDSISISDEDSCSNEYDNEHDLVIDLKENISDRRSGKSERTCLNDQRFHCEYCQKTFSQASNYKTHLKVHGLGDQFYICGLCGRDFQYKNSFQIHTATHKEHIDHQNKDSDKIDRLSCAFCPKRFVFYNDLLRHESTVHTKKAKKKFECSKCHRIFLHQISLRAHYRATSHNLESDHKIPTSINNVLQESTTADAMIHNNNNLYFECGFCGIRMNDASNLRSHERAIHFGERPHACDICGKSFARRHDLKQHLLVHSPERTFQCTVCLKTFKSKKGWTKHKRNSHQEVVKSCLEVTITDIDE